MEKYVIEYQPNAKISMSKGNIKLGKNIYTFNTLPGEHPLTLKDGTILTNVLGTCQGCCEGCETGGCYAIRDAKLYSNSVIPAQGKNTVIMRNSYDDGFAQIKEHLIATKAKVMRWHSSGEIIDYNYLLRMVKLAKELPDVKFYFYTKRFNEISRYVEEYGQFPENLICNLSAWRDNLKPYTNLQHLNQFIWDDGSDPSLAGLPHCPAVSKPTTPGGKGRETGKTCSECGICYSKNNGHKICVYNH